MAKKRTKPARLISAKSRQGLDYVKAKPWRAAVLAAGVVLITFGGIRFYQYSEAATIEQNAKIQCGTFGENASAPAAKCIARKVLLPIYGWQNQYSALDNIYKRESGWHYNAFNGSICGTISCGAYGIPQAYPGRKMASTYCGHGSWRDNATCQMRWGLGYIKSTYGNPNRAWAYWQQHSAY
jgi:hypothetical protein